jgi:5'-nucleotidase
MPVDISNKLVVGISSRALFDLDDSHNVYTNNGLDAYSQYQIDHEDDLLDKGVAFGLVEKLLNIDKLLGGNRVEVILLSRNSADTGLRVFNSIQHFGLNISRAAFCGGSSPYRYVAAFGCQLFLSADPEDVISALSRNVAAATLIPSKARMSDHDDLCIAFDGDAVIFSDEAERIYQEGGLDAFVNSERASAKTPLSGGPFKPFLAALNGLQKDLAQINQSHLLRTALVTARSAPAHERVIRTLRQWDIRLDEALFLGGMDKTEFLKSFGADMFFDDQEGHVDRARQSVEAGHVPHGVANQK